MNDDEDDYDEARKRRSWIFVTLCRGVWLLNFLPSRGYWCEFDLKFMRFTWHQSDALMLITPKLRNYKFDQQSWYTSEWQWGAPWYYRAPCWWCVMMMFLEPWRPVRFKSSHPPARQHRACSAWIRYFDLLYSNDRIAVGPSPTSGNGKWVAATHHWTGNADQNKRYPHAV